MNPGTIFRLIQQSKPMAAERILFSKMHGAGNDFIVIDNRNNLLDAGYFSQKVPDLCHRKYGIGADGILILQADNHTSYRMIYKNADGSDAGMCGNGARCIALFATTLGFNPAHSFRVGNVVYQASVDGNSVIIHFPVETVVRHMNESTYGDLYQVFTGTEHIVLKTNTEHPESDSELIQHGRTLRYSPLFSPAGTNVNFISIKPDKHIRLRTYERGVENLTLACGTGAIASAITAHFLTTGKSEQEQFTVECDGGHLHISFHYNPESGIYSRITLKGPAEFVFKGTIDI